MRENIFPNIARIFTTDMKVSLPLLESLNKENTIMESIQENDDIVKARVELGYEIVKHYLAKKRLKQKMEELNSRKEVIKKTDTKVDGNFQGIPTSEQHALKKQILSIEKSIRKSILREKELQIHIQELQVRKWKCK